MKRLLRLGARQHSFRLRKARLLYERALTIRAKAPGPQHRPGHSHHFAADNPPAQSVTSPPILSKLHGDASAHARLPELEERLRERHRYLAWVDLRVGVATGAEADEGAREAQVLKHCLAEVQRCRPFLIVLLGDRWRRAICRRR